MKKSLPLIFFCFLNYFSAITAEDLAGGQNQKYDSLRLENELTFDIPLEKAEDVWSWMQKYFENRWQSKFGNYDTFKDVEQFTDTYFDTPEHSLVNRAIGLRHRRRFYPNGDIKELIQLKQPYQSSAQQEEQKEHTRGELKFELKTASITYDQGEQEFLNTNLLTLVKKSQIPLLTARLKELGVEAKRLRPVLSIRQERRRIYFRQNGNQFFTLTLDLAASRKLWLRSRFAQLDIEIGEIAFTQASEQERLKLLQVQSELQELLNKKFPEIQRNQTPKIVQMFKVINEQGFVARIVLRYGYSTLLVVGIIFLLVILKFTKQPRIAQK